MVFEIFVHFITVGQRNLIKYCTKTIFVLQIFLNQTCNEPATKSQPSGVLEVRLYPFVIFSRRIWHHRSTEDFIALGMLTNKGILLTSVSQEFFC